MLYEKIIYTAPIDYLVNSFISEYDIRKANISILYKYSAISKVEYDYYNNLPRDIRQITIGKMIGNNPNLYPIISNGVKEHKKLFFETNQINNEDILSIRNDAVFLINKVPQICNFDGIEFVLKEKYTSFYKINKKHIYYYYDAVNRTDTLDIKGLNDYVLETFFYNNWVPFLCELFSLVQRDIVSAIKKLESFEIDYINRNLPIEFYRRFDSNGLYDIYSNPKVNETLHRSFQILTLNESEKHVVDINYNHNVIITLKKILLDIFFKKK